MPAPVPASPPPSFFSPDGHPIANVGVTPDIDARRGTLVAAGEQDTVNPPAANPSIHQVGFRGLDAPAAAAPVPATDPSSTKRSKSPALNPSPSS